MNKWSKLRTYRFNWNTCSPGKSLCVQRVVDNVDNVYKELLSSVCDCSHRLRRQQQNPGLFGKMRSARFNPENPDGPSSDMDEGDDEMQLQIP